MAKLMMNPIDAINDGNIGAINSQVGLIGINRVEAVALVLDYKGGSTRALDQDRPIGHRNREK